MTPYTLRQLEIFIAAAEDCHFVRTANRLGISQAAISAHIATLERHLGKRLFVRRRGTKPLLSNSGFKLLREAKALLSEADKIEEFKSSRQSRHRTTVHLGAGTHLLDDCIKGNLAGFYRNHSDIELECHYVEEPGRGAQLLKDGKLDLMVYSVLDPDKYFLDAEVLSTVPLNLYGGGKLENRRHASPEELSTLPYILPPEGSGICATVQSVLLDAGIVCRDIAAHAQFIAISKDLAKQGEGLVVLFETMLTPEDRAELVRFDVELAPVYRTLFRSPHAGHQGVESVEAFLRDTLTI